MKSDVVKTAYTPGGISAIETCLKVASPPIYLTGYLEFQDQLAENLSEAYVGQKKPDRVLKDTGEAWTKIVKRIGKRRLKKELASYKAVSRRSTSRPDPRPAAVPLQARGRAPPFASG